jgi:predicted RNA binding protein YcfA (HicA-like mRNA interferase family)
MARVILLVDMGEATVKSYSSKEIIRVLQANGWQYEYSTGSHAQFKHPSRPGKITVPHPRKDIPEGTAKSILKHAGI